MNFFERMHRVPREDMKEPVPDRGAKLLLFLLRNHFGKLGTANLLFLVFCIPIITIPASLCALNRVMVRLVCEGNCFLWDQFSKEFRSSFVKSLKAGLLPAVIYAFAYYCLSLCLSNTNELYGILFGVVGAFPLFFAIPWSGYLFMLIPMLDLPLRDIMSNAWKLMFIDYKRALAILGICLLLVFAAFVIFPISFIPMVFCGFSVMQLIFCVIIHPPVQQYIIAPYEAMQKESV